MQDLEKLTALSVDLFLNEIFFSRFTTANIIQRKLVKQFTFFCKNKSDFTKKKKKN